jgi:hypothetical protein
MEEDEICKILVSLMLLVLVGLHIIRTNDSIGTWRNFGGMYTKVAYFLCHNDDFHWVHFVKCL